MKKYDVLSDLDLIVDDENAKNVESWIAALSDGEYLSKFNYTEEAVNDAVDALKRLNSRIDFVVSDGKGVIYACLTGFDNLVKTLTDYMEDDATRDTDARYNVRAYNPFCCNALIVCNEPARDALDDLDIYQLICLLKL